MDALFTTMDALFTALDAIVFVIVLLSGTLAMLRGFTREVLSILSWVVALGASVFAYFNADIRGQVRGMVQPDWQADAVLVGTTFIIVLIIISFITVRLTDFILDSRVGAIDRTLGLLFGVARGMILVAVAYQFFAWLVPSEQQPSWVRNAQARPYMEQSRDVLLSFLPEDPSDLIDRLSGGLRNFGNPEADGRVPDSGTPDAGAIQPDPTGGMAPEFGPIGGSNQRDALLKPGIGALSFG